MDESLGGTGASPTSGRTLRLGAELSPREYMCRVQALGGQSVKRAQHEGPVMALAFTK